MDQWLLHTMNGLAFGMLLFLLSAGFVVTFGLMRFVNIAHGSFFMLGGFIGLWIWTVTGSYLLALIGAMTIVTLLGMLMQRYLNERFLGDPLSQILLTIGIAMVAADASLFLWGGVHRLPSRPELLTGNVEILGRPFPIYRLAIFVMGAVVAIVLFVVLERTNVGAKVRAAVDDRDMARAGGIRVRPLFLWVFAIGAGIAGAAGFLGGPFTGTYIGLDWDVMLLALVVVILGGIGSLGGALVASIYVGLVTQFGNALLPGFAQVSLYVPVVAMLIVRPRGLFGRIEW